MRRFHDTDDQRGQVLEEPRYLIDAQPNRASHRYGYAYVMDEMDMK